MRRQPAWISRLVASLAIMISSGSTLGIRPSASVASTSTTGESFNASGTCVMRFDILAYMKPSTP